MMMLFSVGSVANKSGSTFLYSESQYIAKSVGCCCRKPLNVSV